MSKVEKRNLLMASVLNPAKDKIKYFSLLLVRGMREDIEGYNIKDLNQRCRGDSAETAGHQILEVGSRKNELSSFLTTVTMFIL